MIIKIKRQDAPNTAPFWQEFLYSGDRNASVAHVLDVLNFDDDLVDINGRPARRIRWDCSCMQKICGACAMRINGKPALACDTFLNELSDESLVVLEPLSKFPVVSDLKVDRTVIQNMLVNARMYDERNTELHDGNHEHYYNVSKCLKCGLCLEVCPKYNAKSMFGGAVMANDAYLLYGENGKRKMDIKEKFEKYFGKECIKCLSCMKICPENIRSIDSITGMSED